MTGLPGGTVTFLFTDIEGSTRLLQDLGDEYAHVVDAHRRIMREAMGGHGGIEIDTQGDAFFFSFTRARDAADGAVEAQRLLAAHEWPQGKPVRVRMGLHTGEPQVGEHGYLGIDVVRAARICSAGYGGQILLSETTRALLGNTLPEGASMVDLGQQNLKDIQHERIFELALEDQPRESRPLKTEPAAADSRADQIADSFQQQIESYVETQLEQAFASAGKPLASDAAGKQFEGVPTRLALSGLAIAAVSIAVCVGLLVGIVFLVKILFF